MTLQEWIQKIVENFEHEHRQRPEELETYAHHFVIGMVGRGVDEKEEIEELLRCMFAAIARASRAIGETAGREKERQENPALRAFGEAAGDIRKAERTAARAAMTAVFDGLTGSGANPYFAFAEALKALV